MNKALIIVLNISNSLTDYIFVNAIVRILFVRIEPIIKLRWMQNYRHSFVSDGKNAYYIPLLENSVIVADRFYMGFSLLDVWDRNEVFFVVRHKENLVCQTLRERPLSDESPPTPVLMIELTDSQSCKRYPQGLRGVAVWNSGNEQIIERITNQRNWTANTIGELYKAR